MTHALRQIATAAKRTADRLPHRVIESLAEAILKHGGADSPEERAAISQVLPSAEFRDAAADFLNHWRAEASSLSPDAVAASLITAAICEQQRQRETVEVAWSGPETTHTRFRRTEQAVLEVLCSATRRLTVVSYAVYRIPRIREALLAAVNRAVKLRLIVETPNRIEGQGEYDCLMAMGNNVSSRAAVYYWPQDKRGKDDNGKYGILHVKCVVADGARMFVSSANLTEYAFSINMELGLLVTGSQLPEQVDQHFDRLIESGHLVQL